MVLQHVPQLNQKSVSHAIIKGSFMEDFSPILSKYDHDPKNLISILHDVQAFKGFICKDAILAIADHLSMSPSEIYSVASFYSVFKFQMCGRHTIKVCQGTACHVKGSDKILEGLEQKLGIKVGETTEDGEYSLETGACFGACALAPVVINDKIFGNVTVNMLDEILEDSNE